MIRGTSRDMVYLVSHCPFSTLRVLDGNDEGNACREERGWPSNYWRPITQDKSSLTGIKHELM